MKTKKVDPNKENGLVVARKYKYAKDNNLGFAPFERRVVIECFHGKNRVSVYKRWFVRIQTARRRVMDLAMDNGKVGDVLEVYHVRGLQYMTVKIGVCGFDIKYNPDAFIEA